MKKTIAIFDACGTITKTNNTFDFISYVLKKENRFRFIIFRTSFLFFSIINTLRINELIKKDILRDWSITLMKGFPVDLIERRAKEYSDKIEKKYLNYEILELIQKEIENKNEVIIVSASISPPIKELAKKLNIEYYSSELETINGIYTGKLKKDLLGMKENSIDLSKYDLKNSSIYSDNPEDTNFMINFGEINLITHSFSSNPLNLNGRSVNLINLQKEKIKGEDTDSVNKKTAKWIYIPTMYYIISRFHLSGLIDLFFKEIIPFTFMVYFFTGKEMRTFIVMPLSFAIFYSIYEIGGLFNDLKANEEKDGKPTLRIMKGVKINLIFFVLVRLLFVSSALLFLDYFGYNYTFFVWSLVLCLIVYILHTFIKNNKRLITFISLKILRNLTPLLLFINFENFNVLMNIFFAFFLVDFPRRIQVYYSKRFNSAELIFFENKIKIYSLMTLFSLFIWILLSNPIYFMVSFYFLVISLIGFLFRKCRMSLF